MTDHDRAHAIAADLADADMSFEEVYDLLVDNDIPPHVAREIAEDIRG